MSRLLSLEWHKLVRSKAFYLWTVISAGCAVLGLIMPALLQHTSITNAVSSSIISVVASPVCICFGFFLCGFICIDFDNGFLKNVISKGYKRTTVFSAKYLITLIASIIMILVDFIVVTIVSICVFKAKIELNGTLIVQFFLMILGLSAFCEIAYLLCVIFKKQGPVIGINVILILLVGTGLGLIQPLLKIDFQVASLWILNSIDAGTKVGASIGLVVAGFVCTLVYFVGTYIATRVSVKHLEV